MIAACEEKARIRVWNAADLGLKVHEIGLAGSRTHVIRTFSPKFKREGEVIRGTSREVARRLFEKLREKRLIDV